MTVRLLYDIEALKFNEQKKKYISSQQNQQQAKEYR